MPSDCGHFIMRCNHFIMKCKKCGIVINQCRCMNRAKAVILKTCTKCLQKSQESNKKSLDDRLKKVLKEQKFSPLEILGFQSDYTLALNFGILLGYKIATEDFQKNMEEVDELLKRVERDIKTVNPQL